MLKNKRKIVLRFIACCFSAAIIGWIFYFPYQPERLYRAIPHGALWLGEHHNLSERWQDLINGELAGAIAAAAGVSLEPVRDVINQPGMKFLGHLLTGRASFWAYSPVTGPEHAPTWTVVSWAGGATQLLRMRIPGFWMQRRSTLIGSMNIATYTLDLPNDEDAGSGQMWTLSLGGHEGVLVLCISTSADAAAYAIANLRAGPPHHLRLPLSDNLSQGAIAGSSDWVWGLWTDHATGRPTHRTTALHGVIVDREHLSIKALIDPAPLRTGDPLPLWRPELLDSSSDILLACRLTTLMALLQRFAPRDNPWLRLFDSAIRLWGENTGLILALLNKHYLSEFMPGFNVPVLLIGLTPGARSTDPIHPETLIELIGSHLNMSLFVAANRGNRIFPIEDSRSKLLSAIRPENRPAAALDGQWTLFCSDRTVLGNLLDTADETPASDTIIQRQAPAILLVKPRGASEAIGGWLAVARLMASLSGASDNEKTAATLATVSRITAALQPMGKTTLRLTPSAGEPLAVHLRIETPSATVAAP